MGFNLTRGGKPRAAGINESRLSPMTGLRSKNFDVISSGGVLAAASMGTCVMVNHQIGVTSTYVKVDRASATGGAAGTWRNAKLPFPATPCITLAFSAPQSNRIQLRVRGRDQFGQVQVEDLPEFVFSTIWGRYTAPVTVENGFGRVWCSKVFSQVDSIEYKFPDASGSPPTLSVGLFFTWDPVLYESPWVIVHPEFATFYIFPEAQGIGTRVDVGALVSTQPALYPEVMSLVMWTGTPANNTMANVPPLGGIVGAGGYALGSTYRSDIDAVYGITPAPNPIIYHYSQMEPEQNKLRILVNAAQPVKCFDATTNLGHATGTLYTPAVIPTSPENPLDLFYRVQVSPSPRPAQRLGGATIVPW